MKASIQTECSSCGGTGVYKGFAEPAGVGVVCVTCDGTGCRTIEYTPFTKMNKRKDVREVRRSRGTLIVTGVGPTGESVTYEEFLSGKRPR